jgi:hypothetical protein
MSEANNERAAALEKLNEAFERATAKAPEAQAAEPTAAVEPEAAPEAQPAEPVETAEVETTAEAEPAPEAEQTQTAHKGGVSPAVAGLYDDGNPEPEKKSKSDGDDEWDDDYEDEDYDEEHHSSVGKIIGIVVAALLVVVLGCALVIAEPWVKAPTDTYVAPTGYTEAADKTIAVNETYTFDDLLSGSNEAVSAVEVEDSDILDTDGVSSVTGKGEYFSTKVYVTVSEKTVEQLSTSKEFKLFGKDLSEPYNKIRSSLRNLIGVEKKTAERTELRVLAMYEQNITVSDLAAVTELTGESIRGGTSFSADVTVNAQEGEEFEIEVADETIAYVKAVEEDGTTNYYLNGLASGSTTLTIKYGFYKTVDETVYSEYAAATGAEMPEAGDDGTVEYKIFVPTRAEEYNVSVE